MEFNSNFSNASKKSTKSISETGYAKNISSFQDMINFVISYGVTYAPSNELLHLTNLNSVMATAQAKLDDVIVKNTQFNNAVNARVAEFRDLNELSTRLINALQTTEASKEKVSDARGFIRKLHGKRSGKTVQITDTNTPAPIQISASQQSYDQKVQHFTALISILESENTYLPNESDLKIVNLQTKKAKLASVNRAVSTAHAMVSTSRMNRDRSFYSEDLGLVTIALEVKKYIKSVYGVRSPEYALVSSIEFRNR